ncbi:MAG TPA: hypothetical protein VNQ81_03970 [Povalibacter sp.]|nr:hypothetical protein [Povalibacter sp.]
MYLRAVLEMGSPGQNAPGKMLRNPSIREHVPEIIPVPSDL